MSPEQHVPHSYLFTVRIWPEQAGMADRSLHGRVQLQPGGEVHQFRDLTSLMQLIERYCQPSRHSPTIEQPNADDRVP